MTKCKVCKCWDNQSNIMNNSLNDEEHGLCRVLPPELNRADGRGMWPFTKENDSCGSGKPK